MDSQTAAAGAARATIDRFAESPVVGKPLVNELVELPMLLQKTAPFETRQGLCGMPEIYAGLHFKLRGNALLGAENAAVLQEFRHKLSI